MREITPELLCGYCLPWCMSWGAYCAGNDKDWEPVIKTANAILEKNWGGTNPSPFKRSAATALAMIVAAPVSDHIPTDFIEKHQLDPQIAKLPKILRAILAHDFVTYVLRHAKVGDDTRDRDLTNPIKISPHFYRDLIWLLAQAEFQDGRLFNAVSLIYEACAYQTNPDAQDHLNRG